MKSKFQSLSFLLILIVSIISGSQNLLKANPPVCLIRPLSNESYCVDAAGNISISWNNADATCNTIVQYGPTIVGPWTTITATGSSPGGSVSWAPPTVPGNWFVKLSQGCNAGSTQTVGFQVRAALGGSGTLPDITICAGGTLDLNQAGAGQVTGTGACGNYRYKWTRYDAGSSTWVDMVSNVGLPTAGFITTTWTFNTAAADGGQWALEIYDCQRSSTSPCVSAASQPPYNCGPVRIVFNVNIIIPFNSLTLTPGSTFNVCKGSGQIITAAAAGGGAATYIFERSSNGAIPWTNVQTGSSPTYDVSTKVGISFYRVRLQNAPCAELMSNDVRVDVQELPSGAKITTPGPTTTCVNGSFPQLDAEIIKTPIPGLNYLTNWQMSTDGGVIWTDVTTPGLPPGITFSFTPPGTVPVGETQFRLKVSSLGCLPGIYSNIIKVYGNTGLNFALIAPNPAATTICTSDNIKIDARINLPCPGYANIVTYDVYRNSVVNTNPAWTCPNTPHGIVAGWAEVTPSSIIATGLPYQNIAPGCITGTSPITAISLPSPATPGTYRYYVVARTGCIVGGLPNIVDCQFIDYTINQGPVVTGLTPNLIVCSPNNANWNFTLGGTSALISWTFTPTNPAGPSVPLTNGTKYTISGGLPGPGSFAVLNTTTSDEGVYQATIKSSNSCSDLILTCSLSVKTAVQFTGTNSPVEVCKNATTGILISGITGTFPTGKTDYIYQWRRGTSNLSNGPTGTGSTLSGTDSATLVITNAGAADAGNDYNLNITGYCGTLNVPNQQISLLTPPSLSSMLNQELCVGNNATFTVNGLGSAFIVNWIGPNGAITPGGRFTINANGDMQISNIGFTDAGIYTVTLKNSCNSVGVTSSSRLDILDIPTINTQLSNQTVCPGGNVTFAGSIVTGIPVGTVVYSWAKNNVAIANGPTGTGSTYSGASPTALTITGVKNADAATYTLIAKNKCGEAKSAGQLIVQTSPTISGLVNKTICEDGSVTYDITTGGTGVSVAWKGPTNNAITNGGRFSIASDGDLTINNIVPADEGNYVVTVTGTCAPAVTGTVILTVNRKPKITTEPVSQAVCLNKSATFSVSATGFNINYQWFKNSQLINGATTSTYTIASAIASDEADYTVVISGGCPPNVTSKVAKLKIELSPSITIDPVGSTVCPGDSYTFNVTAGGGVTYQWRKNGVNINGATLSSYTINPVTNNDAGDYDVTVSLPCSSIVSKVGKLIVNNATVVSTQPQDVTVCAGNQVSLGVIATGTNIKYQWKKNGVNIPGSNGSTLILTSASASDAGEYEVIISGDCKPDVTSRKTIVVVNLAPSITTQPTDQNVCIGSQATFSTNGNGTGVSYQWRKNGIIIPGATNSTYTTSNTTDQDDNSIYDVVLSGTCKPDVTSNPTKLTLKRSILDPINTITVMDTTEIDTLREEDVRFKNNGTLPVTVSSISNLLAPFSIVSTTPALLPSAVIGPGQEFVVRVRFTPTEVGERYDTVRITVTDPCIKTFSAPIKANGEDGKAIVTLRLNDTTGFTKKPDSKPDSRTDIIISYNTPPIKLEKVNPTGVTFKISFNGTMLTPVDENLRRNITFSGDTAIMTVVLSGNIPKSGKIVTIPMYILLGNDSVTPLKFYSAPVWSGGKVIVADTKNGSFKALDMCTRGGLRGTRGGSLGITRLTPNPANDKMNVTINSNSEKITINLYDLKGNLILSKNLDNVQSGADYSTDLNFKELSSGMYILIATDGELIDKKMVSIVK